MRNIFLLLPFFFCISATAQFRIVNSDEFTIEVPQNIKSYSIFCHSTSLGWKEVYKGERILLKTALVTNGQETRITEFSANKVVRIQYNYFQKGLLQKAVVEYTNPKSNETFHYKYDTVSKDPIDVKGYKDGKLIYTESRSLCIDTLEIKKHYINVNGITGKERIVAYHSKDKLTSTEVEYRNNFPDTNYSIKKFNQIKQIIEDVDSSSEHYVKTIYLYDIASRLISETSFSDNIYSANSYIYDSNGRLKEEIVSRNDTETYHINYDSLPRETITTKYQSSANQQNDTISVIIKRYDLQGNLIFKESVGYESFSFGTAKRPVSTSVCYWIYKNGRVVKYIYRKSEDGPIITYDVTYDE